MGKTQKKYTFLYKLNGQPVTEQEAEGLIGGRAKLQFHKGEVVGLYEVFFDDLIAETLADGRTLTVQLDEAPDWKPPSW